MDLVKSCWVAAICLTFMSSVPTMGCDDEDGINLHLEQIKSVQVSWGIIAPGYLNVSSEMLAGPFKTVFTKHGIKIDQNNYDNVLNVDIQIADTVTNNERVYSVIMSFHYSEPCLSSRLNTRSSCALWEHYELLQTFTDRKKTIEYVTNTVATTAKLFGEQFDIPTSEEMKKNAE